MAVDPFLQIFMLVPAMFSGYFAYLTALEAVDKPRLAALLHRAWIIALLLLSGLFTLVGIKPLFVLILA